MEKLLKLFQSNKPLSADLETWLLNNVQREEIKKGVCVVKVGEISKYIYYLESGLVRSWFKKKGKEQTVWFNREDDIFGAMPSFIRQKPSYDNLEMLEDSVVWRIPYELYMFLEDNSPEFNWHQVQFFKKYHCLGFDLGHLLHLGAAQDKYNYLMQEKSDLISRIPQKYLYSYLGVSKATYLRNKAKYAREYKKFKK